VQPAVGESELTWNSSLTRVRPFFDQLVTRDPTGEQWLSAVVTCASPEDRVAEQPRVRAPLDRELLLGKHHTDNRLGVKVWMRRCFEHPCCPRATFSSFACGTLRGSRGRKRPVVVTRAWVMKP
jgi:hypothetical protein